MGMNGGHLDRKVQAQRWRTTGVDALNAPTGVWETFGPSLPARRRDVYDDERAQAGRNLSILATRFVVRSSPHSRQIRRTDRLVHDGLTFEIDGIKELPGRGRFIEISAWTEAAL